LFDAMVRSFTPLATSASISKLRNAAQAEAAGRDQHPVLKEAVQRLLGRAVYLFHEAFVLPPRGVSVTSASGW
jgi:hypothetical protein